MPVILTRRDTIGVAAIASTVLNDSAIPGASIKDALEFLDGDKVSYNFENNTISGTGDIYAGSYFGDGSNLTGIDHGTVSGLGDDDHSQYSLADGTRSFTGTVGGILPTSSTHLTTKGYVDGLVQGLDWRDSVLSISGCTPPGVPSTGDRYIVCSTSGVGDWNGMEDYVVEYNGTSWSGSVPNEGFASWVEDEDVLYVYNGTAWVKFGSTITHNNTSGKQGGNGTDEFYHFNLTDYTALVAANRGETVSDIVGTMVTGNTETYITVTYEDGDNTLDFVVNTATDGGTLGVATFAAGDFNVVGGTVNLDDTVPQSVSSDSGSVTPAVNAFTIAGGEGIDTSGTGSIITIAGEDATSANKGIASFDSGDFTVTSGDVVIAAAGVDEAQLNMFNAPMVSGVLNYTVNGMEWVVISTGIDAVIETDIKVENESANCNGSTIVFTLDYTPIVNSIQVFLNGLMQEKGSGKDYTHSGTSITFAVAPLSGDILIIHYVVNN